MKRKAILFLSMMLGLIGVFLGVSCSNQTPNSAFVSPLQTVSANNPSFTPTPTSTFTVTPTPTLAFPVGGFNGPYALGIDTTGKEYVGDTGNNVIRQYVNGVQNSSWPSSKANTHGNGLSYTSPKSIAVDSLGNVYVVGNGSNLVSKYDVNGDLSAQYSDSMNGPLGVACAGTTLYVSDTGNAQIIKFINGVASTFKSSLGYAPNGLAVDSVGNVYVAAPVSMAVYIYAPGGGAGSPASITGFNAPYAVALDSNNNLYVSDTGNKQIEEFAAGNLSAGPINIFGAGVLSAPEGIAVDTSFNVLAVDSGLSQLTFNGD